MTQFRLRLNNFPPFVNAPFLHYRRNRSQTTRLCTGGYTMIKSAISLAFLFALTGTAYAQQVGGCPTLPEGSKLTWEHKPIGDADFCRALRADGTEAFGMYLSAKAPFEPVRSNRAEQDTLDGQSVYWYRSEVALKPGVQTRETLVPLADGRVAHVWLQATSAEALDEEFRLVRGIQFNTARLSSN